MHRLAVDETLVLGQVERGEQPLDEFAETAAGEVVAGGRRAGQADAEFAVGAPQAPVVEFPLAPGDGGVRVGGVRRDDEEFAGGIDDLRGRRQFKRFEQFKCRALADGMLWQTVTVWESKRIGGSA